MSTTTAERWLWAWFAEERGILRKYWAQLKVIKLGIVSVPGVCCITRTQFHDARTFYIPDGTGYHVRNHKLRTSAWRWQPSKPSSLLLQLMIMMKRPLLMMMMMIMTLMTCLFTVTIQWRDTFITQDGSNFEKIIFVEDHFDKQSRENSQAILLLVF